MITTDVERDQLVAVLTEMAGDAAAACGAIRHKRADADVRRWLADMRHAIVRFEALERRIWPA